ncbi:MAG: class I SAM-dependent methyltransferase [Chromatiaceae bacterium]|nr:class I SAM-dependent methyltransferase [Chromatiaceae bacterium]
MNHNDRLQQKWDARYSAVEGLPLPLEVLADNAHLLPQRGDALDLACGLGGSALFLAARGLRTQAWDLSAVAVAALRQRSGDLPLVARVRDVVADPPAPASFDVICVGHFLDRDLCPHIAAALRPGGLLFYQTFSRERVDDSGPGSDGFRLARNELLSLFAGLVVRVYRDEGAVGDPGSGFRNRAQLVAERPAGQA